MTTYVFTHFEMGDSIICNGLVRNLIKKHGHVTLFCKSCYETSIKWMYRDLNNIDFLFFKDYDEANSFIKSKNPFPLLKYGFEYISDPTNLEKQKVQFDEMYYKLANIPFEKRWTDFYVERDLNKEYNFFKEFDIKEKNYIFVHDKYSTETPYFKTEYIRKQIPIIKPIVELTDNIFDYLYLIENSLEIHCVCSSFKNLIDSLPKISCPLFFHKNRMSFKTQKRWISSCKLNWIPIDY